MALALPCAALPCLAASGSLSLILLLGVLAATAPCAVRCAFIYMKKLGDPRLSLLPAAHAHSAGDSGLQRAR